MITVYPILRQQMQDHGTTTKELAAIADIDVVSFHLKMCGIKRWKLTEALKICCFFRSPNIEHLFQKRSLSFCTKLLYHTKR